MHENIHIPKWNAKIIGIDGQCADAYVKWDEDYAFAVHSISKGVKQYKNGLTGVKSPDGHRFGCPQELVDVIRRHKPGTDMTRDLRVLFASLPDDGSWRGYRQAMLLARRTDNEDGQEEYAEVTPPIIPASQGEQPFSARTLPMIAIPVSNFKESAITAIEQGHIRRSKYRRYAKARAKKKGSEFVPTLSHYELAVSHSGETLPLRLDHSLALLKLADDNHDYTGAEVESVSKWIDDDGYPTWGIAYKVLPDGSIPTRDRGSIDHVIPKASGGLDRLVNMQLMRAGANWNKGSKPTEPFHDIEATLSVLNELEKGIANLPETSNKKLSDELSLLLDEERTAARAIA